MASRGALTDKVLAAAPTVCQWLEGYYPMQTEDEDRTFLQLWDAMQLASRRGAALIRERNHSGGT